MDDKRKAQEAVDLIISNLTSWRWGRREWNALPDYVQQGIRTEWTRIVEEALRTASIPKIYSR